MSELLHYTLIFIAVKSLTIGYEFNFYYALRYRKKYFSWYFSRPKFNPDEK